ncbi:hypothetical protein VCRA2133E348_370016 [Vibrio crassostreae]|nr:hypothetical protein VCRA2133E348_370016 [Vibrio crassostreae]CAK3407900.1 hypothetical protein VCRA213O314_380016 [Vibrio crassostreae]
MNEHKRIERLVLFVELAQQLNFTKAAEKLGISKSYLSEQIKRLESDLQCPLLLRTTRSVRLTQEGERALQQGLTIRSQVLQLERSVSEQHDIVKALYALPHQRCLQRCSCSISASSLDSNTLRFALRLTAVTPTSISTKMISISPFVPPIPRQIT